MADGNVKEGRSIGELFSQLATDTSTLVRQEVRLAKLELGEKAAQVGRQVALIAVGGGVAYAGLLTLIAAIVLVLAQYMAPWLSALVVGAVVVAIGCVSCPLARLSDSAQRVIDLHNGTWRER